MTEINTNARANSIQGLGSGLNTSQVINNILEVEARRAEPLEARRDQTQIELDSFDKVSTILEDLAGQLETLASTSLWEGKLVDSSNEDVVTATATTGAQPGNHTLIVDRLALNHQIASQGYETVDTGIGTGRFVIDVGEETAATVVVDETNNTLQGLKDAINAATDQVQATIIKTGNQLKPHQLVLTSQTSGQVGRITLNIELEGGETPNFSNLVEEPSEWSGVGAPTDPSARQPTGSGASTAIPRVIGEYTGEDDKTFTFTAVQTGVVGGESQLQLRWESDEGESGLIELDKFNYAPGEAISFADGLSLVVSEGDILVGDAFTVRARAERSDLFWWLSEEDRMAAYSQPSRWSKQRTEGAPKIDGPYTGEEDTSFRLTVEGSGPIGAASNLRVRWENEEGKSGVVNVGRGYQPGSQLALIDGLKLTLDPGVLNEGDTATFDVTAKELSGRWWLDEKERTVPAEIRNVSNFIPAEAEEEEELGVQPEFPEEFGPRKSTADKRVTGTFESDEPKVYTFTAQRDGTIGTTQDLVVRWEDDKGNSGQVAVGADYELDAELPFDSGLSIAFGQGQVFEGDTFTVRANTSTIQPPQDARIRFGATQFGGGLEITNSTNELDEVIDGVTLNLQSVSEDPVTITIKGDTEKAVESTLAFAEKFNEFLALVKELTKFDQRTEEAGPLLSNRDISQIKETLTSLLIDPVAGLPPEWNMVFNIGLRMNDQGLLQTDENEVRSSIQQNFGAVSDLFRAQGESDNSGVAVVGLTHKTRVNTEGYAVEIQELARSGDYTSPPLVEPILIDRNNNSFYINVDGRRSDPLEIPEGSYTVSEYAAALQNAITNDGNVGDRHVRVSEEGNQIRVISGIHGSRSSIAFEPIDENLAVGVGLVEGTSTAGADVVGTIDGEPAEGLGQVMRAAEGGPAEGLRLLVTLGPGQISRAAPEARVTVTKGVAARMGAFLDRITDPLTGEMKRITDGLRSEIRTFDRQLNNINERLQRRRGELQQKFTRLETQLATLRSQQQRMQAQLSGLNSGGGGASSVLPGLPRG